MNERSHSHLNQSMQDLIPSRNYSAGLWRLEKLNMSEEELFDHLTLELSDLLFKIKINKQLQDKGRSN